MRLITSDRKDVDTSGVEIPENTEIMHHSNPVKSDLYSKLLAYRQSQKKFNIKDLIRDSLK